MNRRSAFRWKLLLLVGASIVGLLAAELGLRIVGFGMGTDAAYALDPYLGMRHAAGFRGWHTREGRAWITINAAGFRDREHARPKPPGTYRIAVLGDSFSEAFQVELEHTYWAILERRLREAAWPPGKRVEVLNFGVSGYGTAQELEMLRHYVWDYEPDLILLQFLAANDVRNNSSELEPDHLRPFYHLVDGRLVLDQSFREDPTRVRFQTSRWIQWKHYVIEHCRLCTLVYQLRHRTPDDGAADAEGEIGLAMQAFRPPDTPAWIRAWELTDRLLIEMHDEAARHDARLVVLMVPSAVEVTPDEAEHREMARRLGIDDFLYPEQRVAKLGAAHGFDVIRMAEAMRAAAKQRNVYFHGFPNTRLGSGHWNEEGHRFAGELVAAALRTGIP